MIEDIGNIEVILDTKHDSIKFLDLNDMTILSNIPIDDFNKLDDYKFLFMMRYKQKQSSVIDNVLLEEKDKVKYNINLNKGDIVIIKEGPYKNNVGKIIEIYIGNIDIEINGKIHSIELSFEDPEKTLTKLNDILLEKKHIKIIEKDGITGNVIAEYYDRDEQITKIVVLSENNKYNILTADKLDNIVDNNVVIPDNQKFNVGDIVIVQNKESTINGIYNGINEIGHHNIIVDDDLLTFDPSEVFILKDIDSDKGTSDFDINTPKKNISEKQKDVKEIKIVIRKDTDSESSWKSNVYNNLEVGSTITTEKTSLRDSWKGKVIKTGGNNKKNIFAKNKDSKEIHKIPYEDIVSYTL
tara:strand:+ start:24 stop:1088 length:1065 start_codon:yes stop_codon:yes gene_type:complete